MMKHWHEKHILDLVTTDVLKKLEFLNLKYKKANLTIALIGWKEVVQQFKKS